MTEEQKYAQERAQKQRELEARRKRARMALALNRFIHGEGKELWEEMRHVFKLEGRIATPMNLGTHFGYDTNTVFLNEGARNVLIWMNTLAAEGVTGDGNIEEPKEKKVIMP